MKKIRDTEQTRARLGRDGRFLMITHQPGGAFYNLDTGEPVSKQVVDQLQGDLFIRAAEDGLFPGFSQTFHAKGAGQ